MNWEAMWLKTLELESNSKGLGSVGWVIRKCRVTSMNLAGIRNPVIASPLFTEPCFAGAME